MAKWTVNPEAAAGNLTGKIEYGDSVNDYNYEIQQHNIDEIIQQVKQDKEDIAGGLNKGKGWRKAFTIPDIVSIDIWEKYGIDIHDPNFMHEPANMKRLRYIIQTEYPYLLIST